MKNRRFESILFPPANNGDDRAAGRSRLVEARGITKSYGFDPVLRGVDFHVERGEFVALMGESGSGKTTLLNLLGGLDLADGGSLVVDGLDLARLTLSELASYRRSRVSIVFQDSSLLPTLTAYENAVLPLRLQGRREDPERVNEIFRRVGLSRKRESLPETLSGGEMQRAALARALALEPLLLLADEPTGSLDTKNRGEVLALMSELNREAGLTIVMVTHSASAAAMAHRILRMEDGRVLSGNVKKIAGGDSGRTTIRRGGSGGATQGSEATPIATKRKRGERGKRRS